ncbi:hypothetical protein Taro_053113 [Colocasia esculenta]|uniref:Uncharacterized protein n=1 Tax=Colocasia esculenta TaxID=4460 RepID=A0A843XK16_COLES|nr:hypothetical protein [Colocasia esculenta]
MLERLLTLCINDPMVVWRSSWWLRSCGTTTRSSSSSPFVCCDLHRPPSWSRAENLCANDSSSLFISFVLLPEVIPHRPRHRLSSDLKPSTSPTRNFLRGSSSITLLVLQNLSLLDSMTSTTVSGTVGGYRAAFLTADQQARFASVKAKLCGHKEVDLADLEKNGMGSLVEALQKIKWTKIATLSVTEADGTLTSMVKGTQIRITKDLLASLFEVSTTGHSGVHSVDTQVNGLGIIGPEFRLKDGKLDINQLSAFNRLLHFIICEIIVPRSASFFTRARADSYLMFWAIQNQEINTAELIIERMKFASSQVWDTKSKLNISLPYAHLLTRIFQHFGISVVGDVSEKMGQAIRSRNLRKSGFLVVNGVWSKTSAAEGESIIGEAQEDLEPVAKAAAVVEPEVAVIDQVVPAAVEEEASRRIEDIPPDFIEPFRQSPEDPLPSSQVATLHRNALDSISQGEQVASESHVAEDHTEEVVMEEAPSQQEQVSVQVDVVMEDAPIEGEHSVAEDIQGESVVASGHTEVPLEDLPVQEAAAAAAQPNVPMKIVTAEEEVGVEKGSETQGEGNENPPENQLREGETASSSDSEDDQDEQPPVVQAREKGKAVAVPDVPLIENTPFQRQMRQRFVINLKPVIERQLEPKLLLLLHLLLLKEVKKLFRGHLGQMSKWQGH